MTTARIIMYTVIAGFVFGMWLIFRTRSRVPKAEHIQYILDAKSKTI